jgi:hypothetical protein
MLLVVSCSVVQFLAKFPEPVFCAENIGGAKFNLVTCWEARFENEEVVVKFLIKRLGPAGTYRLAYFLDGDGYEREFKIRGESRYLYLTFCLPCGWHTLKFENYEDSFYVRPATELEVSENAQIEILSVSIDPPDAKLWETAYVKVTLANRSDVAGRKRVRVWVDNSPMEKWVLVPAGLSVDTYFPITLNKLLFRISVENYPQLQENFRPGIL